MLPFVSMLSLISILSQWSLIASYSIFQNLSAGQLIFRMHVQSFIHTKVWVEFSVHELMLPLLDWFSNFSYCRNKIASSARKRRHLHIWSQVRNLVKLWTMCRTRMLEIRWQRGLQYKPFCNGQMKLTKCQFSISRSQHHTRLQSICAVGQSTHRCRLRNLAYPIARSSSQHSINPRLKSPSSASHCGVDSVFEISESLYNCKKQRVLNRANAAPQRAASFPAGRKQARVQLPASFLTIKASQVLQEAKDGNALETLSAGLSGGATGVILEDDLGAGMTVQPEYELFW